MGAWRYEIYLIVFRLDMDLTSERSKRVEH